MKKNSFKTKRLILRTLKMTDYKVWFDAYVNSEPVKNRWDIGPMPAKNCTKTIFKQVVQKQKKLAQNDDYYRYYVFEKKSGVLIGFIDFDIFVRGTHQFSNFGYQIFNRHWGRGYGQEASAAGLKIGFQNLKLNRLEAAINLDNKKSIRLVRAIGMRKEGLKKRYWFEDGKWVDHMIYVANPEDIGRAGQRPRS